MCKEADARMVMGEYKRTRRTYKYFEFYLLSVKTEEERKL